jgi:hypothetical protein
MKHHFTRIAIFALLWCMLIFVSVTSDLSYAQNATVKPPLGTASAFAVLGASTVTNTGPSVLSGNLGVSPGSAITGFPPGIVHGGTHKADAVALQAQSDVTVAYNTIAGQPCNHDLTGQDLGGKTLTPGVYCFTSSAQLTGQLILDGQHNPASLFLFQIASTLTTASGASVLLEDDALVCNVFWQVGSSATIGTTTSFKGSILALASITMTTGATNAGGLYARTGAVTLDSNKVSNPHCGKPIPTPTKFPNMPNTGSDPYKSY